MRVEKFKTRVKITMTHVEFQALCEMVRKSSKDARNYQFHKFNVKLNEELEKITLKEQVANKPISSEIDDDMEIEF